MRTDLLHRIDHLEARAVPPKPIHILFIDVDQSRVQAIDAFIAKAQAQPYNNQGAEYWRDVKRSFLCDDDVHNFLVYTVVPAVRPDLITITRGK